MSVYICPVCGKSLEMAERSYVCGNRHCFDLARSGYVNLLISKHTAKTVHGDNKLMVQARRDFLDKGYYSPLCDKLCETVVQYSRNGNILLDK